MFSEGITSSEDDYDQEIATKVTMNGKTKKPSCSAVIPGFNSYFDNSVFPSTLIWSNLVIKSVLTRKPEICSLATFWEKKFTSSENFKQEPAEKSFCRKKIFL